MQKVCKTESARKIRKDATKSRDRSTHERTHNIYAREHVSTNCEAEKKRIHVHI